MSYNAMRSLFGIDGYSRNELPAVVDRKTQCITFYTNVYVFDIGDKTIMQLI